MSILMVSRHLIKENLIPCSLEWLLERGLPKNTNSTIQVLAMPLPWTLIETLSNLLRRACQALLVAIVGDGAGNWTSLSTNAVALASTCSPWWAISRLVSCKLIIKWRKMKRIMEKSQLMLCNSLQKRNYLFFKTM